jgi:hypothetical protein
VRSKQLDKKKTGRRLGTLARVTVKLVEEGGLDGVARKVVVALRLNFLW